MAQPVAGIVWDPYEPPPPDFYYPAAAASLWRPELGQQPAPRAHPQNVLPPLSSSLTVNVVHDTAKVSVTQLFQNSTSNAIRAGAYTFPLSAGCTVVEFSCRVGTNRIIRAKIGSKPVARQAFNDAVNRNQTASLLEQDTPEVFTTKLGNIPANERLKTEISFISVLKHKSADDYSTTTLIIPTHIAPRYGPPPTGLSHGLTTGTSRSLSIQVEVVAAEEVRNIMSPTHDITVDMGVGMNISVTWNEFTTTAAIPVANRAQVRLNELNFLDRDFVLNIITQPADGMEAPRAWLETHPLFEEHRALMLTVPPNFMLRNVAANHDAEIIFVADRSGSMRDKMQALKSAMDFFLKGVPSGRKFNIWCFGSTHTSLWPSSRDYSESNLHIALEYVSRNFISNMGGTELLSALKAIDNDRVRARPNMLTADVIILTDGQIWRLDETLKFVQHTRRSTEGRVRFFALGIGNAVSHELVEGIAKAGGGYAEVIPTAGEDGFDGRLLAMLSASLTGHVGPLRIEFEGDFGYEAHDQGGEFREIDGGTILPTSFMQHEATEGNQGTEQSNRPNFLQSPADISTLSPFLWNRVYMLFSPPVTLPRLLFIKIITSTPDGNEVVTRVAVRPLDANDSTLHKLGARALLGDLERGQSWIQLGRDAPSLGEAALVRTEGETLGCKWSLVSKWTSFYAVEEPCEEEGNIPDPLLDEDDAPIPQVVSDIGLLRSRGASGRQMHSATTAAPARTTVLSDEGSDDDEDDDSQSDSWGTDHNDADGGDERRGEGGGASGGGNQGGGDNRGSGGTHGNGGSQGSGGTHGSGGGQYQQNPFPRQGAAAPDAGRERGSTFGGGSYGFPQMPRLINPPSFQVEPATNRISLWPTPTEPPSHPPSHSRHHTSSLKTHREKKPRDQKDKLDPFKEPVTKEKSHRVKEYTPDEKYVLKVGRSERALSSGEGYLYSSGTSIHAPRSNLPASTSLLQTGRRDAQTPEEKDGEQLVRRLLVFQSFDGSFQTNRVHELDQLLGESFISFTSHLVVTETVSLKSAVTAAIVALLEETFQFCKDLWVMMVTKAKEYLANAAAPSLLTYAKELLKKLPANPNSDKLSSSPPAPSPTTAYTHFPSPTPPDPGTGDRADSSQPSLWATSSDTVQLARIKRFNLHRASMFSIPSAPSPTTASTNFPSPTLPNPETGNQADSSYPNLWANSNETAQLVGTERSKQLRARLSRLRGPTPSQSITRGTMALSLDCGISSGSTTDEIHLTKPQPPHQANKTPAIVGSPSQKLTTGLYGNRGGSIGRRVILDTVPADDSDI